MMIAISAGGWLLWLLHAALHLEPVVIEDASCHPQKFLILIQRKKQHRGHVFQPNRRKSRASNVQASNDQQYCLEFKQGKAFSEGCV